MFSGRKYMTIGIKEKVGLDTQLIIWEMINELKRKKDFHIDYLQVFELEGIKKDGLEFQKITHKQEIEPYENTEIFTVAKAINEKIFVISSGNGDKEYSTMMLSHEY